MNPEPGGTPAEKPLLRGWSHLLAAVGFPFAALYLILQTHTTAELVYVGVYAICMEALFLVSALLHRIHWEEVGRRRMRRADHSTIFLAIAGSYTAVAGLSLTGTNRLTILIAAWAGSAVGIAIRNLWLDAPKWANTIPYVVVGWCALLEIGPLAHALGGWGLFWMFAGGLAYTVGAVAYGAKRPNLVPGVFGYHELFHAGTIVGATCHYVVILCFALPVAERLA